MDLVFLLFLVAIGWGLWEWLSGIVQGDFPTAVGLTWLMAFGTAGWWTREQRFVLRLPAGFLLYLALVALAGPFSAWSGSKIAVAATACLAALAAKYGGAWWSRKLEPRAVPGVQPPWWLDQSINLLHDLFRWVGACIVAFFTVGVVPLVLVMVMPPDAVPWGAMVWGFAAAAFYIYKYRAARWRPFKLPLGLCAFVITAAVLKAFQKQMAGPLEAGSFEEIVYVAYWPVVAALFVEFVVVGTRKATA